MPIVAADDSPEVVAIVATMGRDKPRLYSCIESLRAGSGTIRLALVCVVNSSTAIELQLDDVTVLPAGLNLGWGGALTFGASQSDSPLIWFVQDDMVVTPTTLTTLLDVLTRDSALAAVVPLVVGPDGLVPAGSCGGMVNAIGNIREVCPPVPCLPQDLPASGALSYYPSRGMLVRREGFAAVGGSNARMYPVQFGDVDFSYRLRESVGELRLVTDAVIGHEINGSSPVGFAWFLHERNIETFVHRWLGPEVHAAEPFFAVAPYRPDPVDAERLPLHPQIPPQTLAEVAQSAADALTHLGKVFAVTREELAQALAARDAERAVVAELRSSRSWKATAALRAVSDLMRRIARR